MSEKRETDGRDLLVQKEHIKGLQIQEEREGWKLEMEATITESGTSKVLLNSMSIVAENSPFFSLVTPGAGHISSRTTVGENMC